MKYFFTLIIFLISNLLAFGQIFDIETIMISDSSQFKSPEDFVRNDTAFFQDENYYVRRSCKGEWGGSIWFKNKNTEIEYACRATCPISINKLNNNYIVTSSLGHFRGFSEIIEIENPDSMEIFQLPKAYKKKKKMEYHNVGDDESKSSKGTKIIVDTIGVIILVTFPFEEQLYHIVSDSKMTYLCQIKDNYLVTLDTIIHDNLDKFRIKEGGVTYNFGMETIVTKDNHHVVLFINEVLLGYLDVYKNKIRFYRYK